MDDTGHYDIMETSSYLFMRKRKRHNFSSRKMDKRSSSDSNISLDSLENNFNRNTNPKRDSPSDDNVDTILVPFYEKDVLIKVHTDQKKKIKQDHRSRKDNYSSNSYLIKKNSKVKAASYLERFRKQFAPHTIEKKEEEIEIRSISPEYGDTERESFGEDDHNPVTEFYESEAYNEIYYDKILNKELENYLVHSFNAGLNLDDGESQSADEYNLKSVSEVSQPHRRVRRATVQPLQNVKLGGLGPDMEKIKPRLERARSLQRYSEKVRMENRLKIYKRSLQIELEKKEGSNCPKQRFPSKDSTKVNNNNSYLINHATEEKSAKPKKPNSAKTLKCKEMYESQDEQNIKDAAPQQPIKVVKKPHNNNKKSGKNAQDENNVKTSKSARSSAKSRGINTDKEKTKDDVPPVQISFLVNVGGVRPSSALRTLEEKHRMYQEKIKAFTFDSNNNT